MLLSRTADALYWLSRYLERAEFAARLISVRLDLGLDRRPEIDGWDFHRTFESLRLEPASQMPATPSCLVDVLFLDGDSRDSVASCLATARANARHVREEISSDMWTHLNGLYLRLQHVMEDESQTSRPHSLAQIIIEGVQLFQGITDATMGHGEGWHYLQVGRFLERAVATAALLDLHFRMHQSGAEHQARSHSEHVGLLRSCGAIEAYCRHYTADVRPERVLEFLLLNPEFPAVGAVRRETARDVAAGDCAVHVPTLRREGRARRRPFVRAAVTTAGFGRDPRRTITHSFLAGIAAHCEQLHVAINQVYIGYPIESALPA